MKFIDYMKKCIKEDIEFDAIIGDVEMSHTFCFTSDMKFTKYCKEKYKDLLVSEIRIIKNNGYFDVVEVLYDNEVVGEKFAAALAGYVSEKEYEKLFG